MKKKNWFDKKIKSNDKPLAYSCFNTTTTPIVTKFVTTTTIDYNIDVKYVEPECKMEKMKADIGNLSRRVFDLEDNVKKLYDDVIFLTY